MASTGLRWQATSRSAGRSPTRGPARTRDQVRGVSIRVSKRLERRVPGIPMAEYGAAGVAFLARLATSGRALWVAFESMHSRRRSRPVGRKTARSFRRDQTADAGAFLRACSARSGQEGDASSWWTLARARSGEGWGRSA
jgi:hypothetical protein